MMGKNFNISRKKLMLFQYGVNCVLLKKKPKNFLSDNFDPRDSVIFPTYFISY